jgi:hypothetical protein
MVLEKRKSVDPAGMKVRERNEGKSHNKVIIMSYSYLDISFKLQTTGLKFIVLDAYPLLMQMLGNSHTHSHQYTAAE